MRKSVVLLLTILPAVLKAQVKPDSSMERTLQPVTVLGIKTVRGTGHMPEIKEGIVFAGKKNEVVLVDSLDANKAINNTRQILGRIPGLNIVETESSGFTANGIATRGLNPTQSIEMNTRQNGYNISADNYGYNESYYLPPMEAVSRIEMVRGAASLQFGSHFGGMVNYVLNEAPKNKAFELNTSLTGGSFGLFNVFGSVGGTLNKWSYYAFVQNRNMDGWQPNSRQWQLSGFGRIQYNPSSKWTLGIEYTLLRNRLKMPGGLTDSMFSANPRASFRSRNWLKTPWNVVTAYSSWNLSPQTSLYIKSSLLFSQRALVWRNEDGGPAALDEKDPATGEYINREVGIQDLNNSNTEIRFIHNYSLGKTNNNLAGGLRFSHAWLKRKGGGLGTRGTDFDLSISGEFGYVLDFSTTNLAPFVENIFHIGDRFSITPGFRFEYLRSSSRGYKEVDNTKLNANENRDRYFPLFGLGLEYKTTSQTSLYANISQAYRPIEYSEITPFGVSSRIDPNLKDAQGYNADLGYRGTVKNFLNFDIGFFYLAYNNRIGTVLVNPGTPGEYTLRTNVANSVHKGIESYVEFNILKFLRPNGKKGLNLFHSFGFTDAKYTRGEFKGNRVEAAARVISRTGLIYHDNLLSATFQVNHVGDAFGDAGNTRFSPDAIAGYIPSYTVLDFSATYRIKNLMLKAGANNLANAMYFTRRADEYPGPGIIPSIGRSYYVGISARF